MCHCVGCSFTLGVIGVVGGACRRRPQWSVTSRWPKLPNFIILPNGQVQKTLPNTRRCWSRERCLSPTPPIVGTSRLPKVPNFIGNPLFCLFQNKVGLGCLPCPYKKFKRKKPFHNFEIFGKTFLAILSMTKEKTDERSCVIVLDTFTLGVVGVVGGD